jgi:hypothetical protein
VDGSPGEGDLYPSTEPSPSGKSRFEDRTWIGGSADGGASCADRGFGVEGRFTSVNGA